MVKIGRTLIIGRVIRLIGSVRHILLIPMFKTLLISDSVILLQHQIIRVAILACSSIHSICQIKVNHWAHGFMETLAVNIQLMQMAQLLCQ